MITVSRLMQYENAHLSIEVTELGIVTHVNKLHEENALSLTEVTEHGIVYVLLAILGG